MDPAVDPVLATAYERCRALHRAHGRTYYLATRLLPRHKRRHVHALYGFTRHADEIVDAAADNDGVRDSNGVSDSGMSDGSVSLRRARLREWSRRFTAGLRGEPVDDPLLPAVLHTIETYRLDRADFTLFLRSMEMDLTVDAYPEYRDLLSYMEGSAAAIGTMMLPILGAADPSAAREPARQLGFAFQLTNFIRDVGEDLDRGRVYLPQADLDRFGVSRADLARREPTPAIRELIRYEIGVARGHYRAAAPGVQMLEPASQACIRTAFHLYGRILNEVENAGYDVFRRRARVPMLTRLRVAAGCLSTRPGTPVALAGGDGDA